MAAILVNYDLRQAGQKYDDVVKLLESYPTWAHFGGSSWIVVGTGLTAESVNSDLLKHTDENDTLLVIDVTGRAYRAWTTQDMHDWLQKHVRG